MTYHFTRFGELSLEQLKARTEVLLHKQEGASVHPGDVPLLFSCIDHTTLDGLDETRRVAAFCREVARLGNLLLPRTHVAAVCVYPLFASVVSATLAGTSIKTACVAGAFPSGQSPLQIRLDEATYAIDHGAEEIDMVISRGRLACGDDRFVFDEIAAFRERCQGVVLKVILETGELKTPQLICQASEIALQAGADFLKTSTGKAGTGATPEALLVMMDCIKAHYLHTGRRIGIKPSGGIAEPKQALDCLFLLQAVLGDDWANPGLFRIGASRLTTRLFELLNNSNDDRS